MQKLWLCASLAAPVLAGLAWMISADAPRTYIVGNAAALLLSWALILLLRVPAGSRRHLVAMAVAGISLAGLAATIIIGPEVSGVRRWLPVGPLRLHGGMLLLPALVAMIPFMRGWLALLSAGLAALIVWIQPDGASALGLLLAMITLALCVRNRWLFIACGLAAATQWMTPAGGGGPAAVPFVEGVNGQSFNDGAGWGVLLLVALTAGLVGPARIFRLHDRRSQVALYGTVMAIVGYAVASLISAFPTPLIGYSPAPILGFGLAMGLICALDNAKRVEPTPL